MLYSGREFTEEEIHWINEQTETKPGMTRYKLSKHFCERFNWRKPDGGLKDMRCRVAHLRMAEAGVITLPKARKGHFNKAGRIKRTLLAEPGKEITAGAGSFDRSPLLNRSTNIWYQTASLAHAGGELISISFRCGSDS